MANITRELNQIKSAIYGKDVRGSIHDGIDKINKETEKATQTSEEAIEVTNQLLDGSFDQGALNTNIEERLNDLETQYAPRLTDVEKRLIEFGVSYKMFGAELDGVTDDTIAIQNAHNFANEHGYPVIQRNAKFVLNGEIEVKTDVDLSGSVVITTWVDASIEHQRTNTLYRIKGEEAVDITSQVNRSDFVKGATTIPSLSAFNSGSIIIRTTDIDLLRNDAGVIQNVYKSEINAISENSDGNLAYALTKDYSKSTGFRVLFKPFQEPLTFNMPKLILDNAQIYSFIKSERNNVIVNNGFIEEINTLSAIAPIYTIAEFVDSHDIKLSNTICPIIGRDQRTGQNGLGYLFLFTRASKIKIDRADQLYGWSGINGNWFRDVSVTNSNILSVSGHANAYDIDIKDCRIYKSIVVHGGGILNIDNCYIDGRYESVAITTRKDYAAEFDGLIRVKDTTTIHPLYLVQIHSVDYDCGRKVYLPSVEIDNCHMRNPDNQATYLYTWRGFNGNYAATLPKVKIDGFSTSENDARHKTLYLPQKISNALIKGAIDIEINDISIPITTFNPNPYDSNLANIQLPHITNNNVKLNLKVKNSLANFALFGTSNIFIKCEDCDVYAIRTGTNSADSVTQNGDALNMEIANSDIYRGFTDFPDRGGADRIILSVVSSRYLKYYDANGQTDNAVSPSFADLIKYAKNNKAVPTIILPSANPGRLFNYTDDKYWQESSDVGINTLKLSYALDNAVMEYYRYEGVIAIAIDYMKINRAIAGYGLLQIASLPVGYRPKTRIKLPLTSDNSVNTAVLDILPTGEVRIYSRQSTEIASGSPFSAYATFI